MIQETHEQNANGCRRLYSLKFFEFGRIFVLKSVGIWCRNCDQNHEIRLSKTCRNREYVHVFIRRSDRTQYNDINIILCTLFFGNHDTIYGSIILTVLQFLAATTNQINSSLSIRFASLAQLHERTQFDAKICWTEKSASLFNMMFSCGSNQWSPSLNRNNFVCVSLPFSEDNLPLGFR